jgi:hypothetical protein
MISSGLRLVLTVAVVLLWNARSAAAETAVGGELPIIAKARAWCGPDAALDALQSVHFTGTVTTEDSSQPGKQRSAAIDAVFEKPDRHRFVVTSGQAIETTVLDGFGGWVRVQDPTDAAKARVTLLGTEQVKRLRASVWETLYYFRGIKGILGSVEDRGATSVDGVACQKVAFVHSPTIAFIRYFDLASGRLVLSETESGMTMREEGELTAGGIRFPAKLITTKKIGDRTQTVTITYDKVMVNDPLPAAAYALPLRPRG